MSDRQATVDGVTHSLGRPFLVLATQNPYEFEGTYPLPESQLDRFLLRARIGYPDRQAERQILTDHRQGEPVQNLHAVVRTGDVLALQSEVRDIRVDDSLSDYILDLVVATRNHPDIHLGASTRAALFLSDAKLGSPPGTRFCRARRCQALVAPVLAHRLITKTNRQGMLSDSGAEVIASILEKTAVPA